MASVAILADVSGSVYIDTRTSPGTRIQDCRLFIDKLNTSLHEFPIVDISSERLRFALVRVLSASVLFLENPYE